MKVAMLLMVLALVGCGKGGDSVSSAASCSPTKPLMSTWVSRTSGTIFKMDGCTVGSVCSVQYGSGSCSDSRGDFLMLVKADGTAAMANCADTILYDRATYELTCSNLLKLTYESDGEVELFE